MWFPADRAALLRRYYWVLGAFIAGLVLSGVTAFPLLIELKWLARAMGLADAAQAAEHQGLAFWILTVRDGLADMYGRYPWIAYGTDWLAFGHLMIALFFIGPWRDPLANAWVLQVGLVACALVVPLAFICGAVRGIPFYWRLVDCSFGVFGAVPLLYALALVRRLRATAPQGTS